MSDLPGYLRPRVWIVDGQRHIRDSFGMMICGRNIQTGAPFEINAEDRFDVPMCPKCRDIAHSLAEYYSKITMMPGQQLSLAV